MADLGRANDHKKGHTEEESAIAAEAVAAAARKRRETSNAFSELMKPKRPKLMPLSGHALPASGSGSGRRHYFHGSDGLGVYITNPAAYLPDDSAAGGPTRADPSGTVIFYTDDFVAIHDKFPKATVHCLLLPRDRQFNQQQPLELLSRRNDEASRRFLAGLRVAAERLRGIVAAELRRKLGGESAQDAAREAFMRGEGDGDEDENENGDVDGDGDGDGDEEPKRPPPPGRDWAAEVLVGVHARPSMSHLHVHVLSRDMHSERLRNRNHYNSFATPFFVSLDAFPLAADDPLLDLGSDTAYLQSSLACWRCGRQFGNKFAELKRHLEQEFLSWKRE